jgi:hypothetical protein
VRGGHVAKKLAAALPNDPGRALNQRPAGNLPGIGQQTDLGNSLTHAF